MGYNVQAAMADTIGAAWAIARFGQDSFIIESGQQTAALLSLPPAALRLETDTVERLQKLGTSADQEFYQHATFCSAQAIWSALY